VSATKAPAATLFVVPGTPLCSLLASNQEKKAKTGNSNALTAYLVRSTCSGRNSLHKIGRINETRSVFKRSLTKTLTSALARRSALAQNRTTRQPMTKSLR
jgi:hypothetical protein